MRNLLFLLISLYLGFHLFTLDVYPLATDQEVQLASVNALLSGNGTLLSEDKALLTQFLNHPAYHTIAALFTHFTGFSNYSYRIIHLIFGLLALLLVGAQLFQLERGKFKNAAILICGAILADGTLQHWVHQGLADGMALFFLLLSIRKEFNKSSYTISSTFFSALFMGLAIMSQPAVALLLPLLLVIKLFALFYKSRNGKVQQLFHLFFWPLFIGLTLLPWFLVYYNTVGHLPSEVFWNLGSRSSVSLVSAQEWVLMTACLLALLTSLFTNVDHFRGNTAIYLSLGIIVICQVSEIVTGNHYTFAHPFYYLLFFSLLPLNKTDSDSRVKRYIPLFVLTGITCLLCLLQTTYLLYHYFNLKNEVISDFIQAHVPAKSTVKADASSFYALTESQYVYAPLLPVNGGQTVTYILLSEATKKEVHENRNVSLPPAFKETASLKHFPSTYACWLHQLGIISTPELYLHSVSLYKHTF